MNTGKRKLLVMLILTFLLIPIQMGSVQPNYGQSLGTSRPSLSKSDIYDIESQSNSMTSNNFDRKPSQSLQSITSYTDHIPISILNDSAFGSSGYNFNGSGSQNDPYLITNYRIIDSSGILIHVENTTANFVIQDCILDGITEVHTGIYLRNVTAGTISRNVLSNNYHGCYLSAYSSNNVIKNNRMSNTSSTTIILSTSGSNDIFDNEIQSSKGHGIYVGPYSGGNRIFRNTITDIALSGVFFKSDSHYGDAINNTLSNIGEFGVNVEWNTLHHEIIGNLISNTSLAGIRLASTGAAGGYRHGATISNNTILNSKKQGIQLIGQNFDVPITRNTIFNSTGYGIEINTNSDDNEVRWNNFFHNNGGGTQAFDNGTNNVFEYNHWNDYISPDVDMDGFVDSNYIIDGGSKGGLRLPGTTTSYMRRANPINTFVTTAFTVELWVYPNETRGYSFSYASSNSDNEILIGSLANAIYVGGASTGTGLSINIGEWTHIVVTWQSSDGNTTIWINGTLRFNATLFQGSSITTGGSLVLGHDQDHVGDTTTFNFGQAFNGSFDEVRILNRVLNQSEILEDYNAPNYYPDRSGTIAWYHLDDTGTIATDSAGVVGDAAVVGGMWIKGARKNNDSSPRVTPIWIGRNSDFVNYSTAGSGTSNDPFIIENQYFLSNQTRLIEIQNADAHFIIKDFVLDGLNGFNELIYLNNVTNGKILNNYLSNAAGIAIFSSGGSSYNTISANTIYDCSSGITIHNSGDNLLTRNYISNTIERGIYLTSASDGNTITYNILCNSTGYGLEINYSDNCIIENNNFFDNNLGGTSQAYDNGSNNLFNANHWNDQKSGIYYIDPLGIDNQDLSSRVNPVPALIISSPLAGTYKVNQIMVTLEGTALHFWYYIAGKDIQNQTWMTSSTRSLGDGTYTLHVYSLDHIGVTTHKSVLFTIDTTPPIVTITSLTNRSYNQQSLTLTYTVSEQATLTVYVNGIATNYPSDSTLTGPDGRYNVTIVAVDTAGNVGQTTVIYFVDTVPPTVNITSPSATTYTTSSITITLSGSDDVQNWWYYIEGVDSANKTWTETTSRNLPNGVYTLHAYSNDTAGNEAHASVTFTIAVPTTTTTTTTTTKKSGTFPPLFTVLLFFCVLVIVHRRQKI